MGAEVAGKFNSFNDFWILVIYCNYSHGFKKVRNVIELQPISGRVDRASATGTVDSGSIPGRVIPKTIKIGIHSFPAWRSAIKGTVWSLRRVW